MIINVCAAGMASSGVASSGVAASILSALPGDVYVTDDVIEEMRAGHDAGYGGWNMMETLLKAKALTVKNLGVRGMDVYAALVSGAAQSTLGDGEASTIALAWENGWVAATDDRKALRLCRERFPEIPRASTVDILSHPAVVQPLGRAKTGDAVFAALKHARMYVLPEQMDWVIQIIGATRAKQCPSLPLSVRMRLP